MIPGLSYDLVLDSELDAVHALESASFPPDEAASLSTLRSRHLQAPTLFLGAYLPAPPSSASSARELVAFTCSTLTALPTLTASSMSSHDPAGMYVAIHSVCVAPAHRRKGVARSLLGEYLRRLKMEGEGRGIKGVRLIMHEELKGLYEGVGFRERGSSEVCHGERAWEEMGIDFDFGEEEEPKGEHGVVETMEMVEGSTGMNKVDLFCPRECCHSIILKAGVGKWVLNPSTQTTVVCPVQSTPLQPVISLIPASISHRTKFQLPLAPLDFAPSPSSPSPLPQGYWSIPSPLSFENIGFSKNVPSRGNKAPDSPLSSIKYLICADCDTGPLGWHDTQGTDLGMEVAAENERGAGGQVRTGREFWLDSRRVRYAV